VSPPRTTSKTPPEDYVSRIVAAWRTEHPDLDLEPVAIVFRLSRLASRMAAEARKVFVSSGITNADFAVLAILRRRPAPYRVSQKVLQDSLGVTSGTISLRIDRLVELGLVAREVDDEDARSVIVSLTSAGESTFDSLASKQLDNEAGLVTALDPWEKIELARLLQALLAEFEPLEQRPGQELGIEVASAHVTRERRRSVGLSDLPGLLVEAVHENSPGESAGLRVGDLLVASGELELRSLTCLATAIGTDGSEVPLSLLRSGKLVTVTVEKPASTSLASRSQPPERSEVGSVA